MTDAINPYSSPAFESNDPLRSDVPLANAEGIDLLIAECRKATPWLLTLSVSVGLPVGIALVGSILLYTSVGPWVCVGMIPLYLLVWVIVQLTNLRFAIQTFSRLRTVAHEVNMIDAYRRLFTALATLFSALLIGIIFVLRNLFH